MKDMAEIKGFDMGDEGVFNACFRRHYRTLCYFATRYLGDASEAEDVVQDVFVRLLERKPGFRDEEHVERFLYRSVRNACINRKKEGEIHAAAVGTLRERAAEQGEAGEDEFFSRVVRAEVYREIMAAIDELPEQCGRVFTLAYVDGLDNEEVARELGIAVNTVKVQKNRAKARLRERLKDLYPVLFLLYPLF